MPDWVATVEPEAVALAVVAMMAASEAVLEAKVVAGKCNRRDNSSRVGSALR